LLPEAGPRRHRLVAAAFLAFVFPPYPFLQALLSSHAGGTVAVEHLAVENLVAAGLPVYCGGFRGREVALTFDDGPGVYTRRVLRILRRAGDRATFFVVGRNIARFPGVVAAEARLAALGDHTWSHPFLPPLSARTDLQQLAWTKVALETAAEAPVWLFRPPYGASNARTSRAARHLHLLDVRWDVSSGDSAGANWRVIGHRVLSGARPGAIVLMHENRGQTVRALRYLIIPGLRRLGYRPVTVPQLLADDPPSRSQLRAGYAGCHSRMG
jgi:peptidoglycan/xylan/chitin deacetylase (PgdA/CDA1 family)